MTADASADVATSKLRVKRPEAGFLLVEVLATMAISAMILVALASLISLTMRASDQSRTSAQDTEDVTRMMAALATEVEAIAPRRWPGAGGGFLFSGSSSQLIFAAEAPTGDGSRETRLVNFRSSSGSTAGQLDRLSAPLMPGSQAGDVSTFGAPQAFYRGRFAISFAYFGVLPSGDEVLSDDWINPEMMPVAVRISMRDPRDGSLKAALRVPILVDAEPGCAMPKEAPCSFAPKTGTDSTGSAHGADAPIDPDDEQGWLRYVQ